jgi:hypothetical protein
MFDVDEYYRNHNLGKPNLYYKVVQEFDLFIQTGIAPSNEWFGASQIHRAVYSQIKAKKGDRIANLHGGIFYLSKYNKGLLAAVCYPCVMVVNTRSAFEKGKPPFQEYPVDNLQTTEKFELTFELTRVK